VVRGLYVFVDDAARDEFQAAFTETAAESPGSRLIGSAPVLIEPCTIVAVAQGAAGFAAAPRHEAGMGATAPGTAPA
jgi:hypothetical protein